MLLNSARGPGFLTTLTLAALVASSGIARGQSSTTPSTLTTYSTIYSIGVEWQIVGDGNHNAQVSVDYRVQGTSIWLAALPLVRIDNVDANMLAGSVLFLTPGTSYDVRLILSDPDGGSATQTRAVATRAVPQPTTGGRTLHVAPGSGSGDGSAAAPYRGIAQAQAAAASGDMLLLHQGDYGGRVLFDKSGAPGRYIAWIAAGDG